MSSEQCQGTLPRREYVDHFVPKSSELLCLGDHLVSDSIGAMKVLPWLVSAALAVALSWLVIPDRFDSAPLGDESAADSPISDAGAEPNVDYFQGATPRDHYLDLLKLSLTDLLYENDPEARIAGIDGRDWPSRAYTMIGMKRLDNLQTAIEDVLASNVPGDFLEAGAWRGGATIFMRGVLEAYGVRDRVVWVADSFEGLPEPDPERYPADRLLDLSEGRGDPLIAPVPAVRMNFERYGLYDDQVRFLVGWFEDTLPVAPIERLAILRVDGDLYQSTMDALTALYDRVSPGGWIIVDDYALPPARKATDDFRRQRGIEDELVRVDWTGVYWIKATSG